MRTRRAILRAGVCAAGLAGAGCLGRGDRLATAADSSEPPTVYAALFPLYDFVRQVGGDAVTAENAVEPGEHGHGWDPPADLVPTIVEADAFVHLGVEGFQPWVDTAVDRIADEHGDEVVLIDALEGIELRRYDEHVGAHDHDHDDDDDHDHDDDDDHGHDHDDEDDHDHDHNGEEAHDHDHDGEEAHDHVHGEYDAKFFSDPLLAVDGVRNVRDGLIELDPGNADRYERAADDYCERLEELHDRYAAALADRAHDVAVLAGHDSFGYLADRHGFDVHTPVGLSPDHEPSPGEIADTVELVDERAVEYVLWDYFDGDRLAEAIVAEADSATEAVMVSPAESTATEWEGDGIDSYVAQLAAINLPAFEKALGADGE